MASADGVWAIRVSLAGEMGCSERLGCEEERVERKEEREWSEGKFFELRVQIRARDLTLFQSALSNFNCTIVSGMTKTMKINKN